MLGNSCVPHRSRAAGSAANSVKDRFPIDESGRWVFQRFPSFKIAQFSVAGAKTETKHRIVAVAQFDGTHSRRGYRKGSEIHFCANLLQSFSARQPQHNGTRFKSKPQGNS